MSNKSLTADVRELGAEPEENGHPSERITDPAIDIHSARSSRARPSVRSVRSAWSSAALCRPSRTSNRYTSHSTIGNTPQRARDRGLECRVWAKSSVNRCKRRCRILRRLIRHITSTSYLRKRRGFHLLLEWQIVWRVTMLHCHVHCRP